MERVSINEANEAMLFFKWFLDDAIGSDNSKLVDDVIKHGDNLREHVVDLSERIMDLENDNGALRDVVKVVSAENDALRKELAELRLKHSVTVSELTIAKNTIGIKDSSLDEETAKWQKTIDDIQEDVARIKQMVNDAIEAIGKDTAPYGMLRLIWSSVDRLLTRLGYYIELPF